MPPQEENSLSSEGEKIDKVNVAMPGFRVNYPSERDLPLKVPAGWFRGKRNDDAVGNLWRIHDKLYDLSHFMQDHPGGAFWIEASRGTDITEAFETAHVNPKVASMLPAYCVGDASGRRNSPFTFNKDDFYCTLKRKAWDVLRHVGTGPTRGMRLMTDGTAILFMFLMLVAAHTHSYVVAALAGSVLSCLLGMAHNFFHQANNFRMYYFDLSPHSSYEWRITHAFSHHLFTNTLYDFEVSMLEPFIEVLPNPKKSPITKCCSMVMVHLALPFLFFVEIIKRILSVCLKEREFKLENLFVYVELFIMVLVSGSFGSGIRLWAMVMASCSFWFAFIGLTSSHHHPDLYHAHDNYRQEPDWGMCQLDSVRDKIEVTGSLFLVASTFGDHTLHHLFPTVDHSKLPLLYPALMDVCEQFKIPFSFESHSYLWIGLYLQMLSSTPNKNKPGFIVKDEPLLPKVMSDYIGKYKEILKKRE